MNELNQNLSESLSMFLMDFRDEVVNGIQEYMRSQANMSLESV